MSFADNIQKIMELRRVKPADLARDLGISRQKLSNWESGTNEPRKETLKELADYLKVAKELLLKENLTDADISSNLTGNSTVTSRTLAGKIPFYDTIAVGGNNMLAEQQPISEPIEYINPGDLLKGASGTLRIYGHSMFPKYPSGCIVAFKQSKSKVIVWGEDYVIELEDRRIIKRVEKSKEKDYIKAVSYNVNNEKYIYDPIEIPLSEVRRLYMVLGKVELEASI